MCRKHDKPKKQLTCYLIEFKKGSKNFDAIMFFLEFFSYSAKIHIIQIRGNNVSLIINLSVYDVFLTFSVVIIAQNYFEKSKFQKTFARQFSGMYVIALKFNVPLTITFSFAEKVLFFDRADALQLSIISRQIFPTKASFLYEIFQWLHNNRSEHLKYILIDGSSISSLPYHMMIRTAIFPEKDSQKTNPIFFFPHDN
jgi:hypothetical protein